MKVQKYLDFPWSTEDTIENLKELKEILQEQLRRKNYEGQGKRDAKEIALDFDRAIQALKEVEQYRVLGTVEELKKAREKKKSRREWYQKGYQDGLNADKWIHCEERLPEPIRPVLVTVKNWINDKQFVRMGRFHTNHWEVDGYVVVNSKVIAWQPLPQPYKKEGAE